MSPRSPWLLPLACGALMSTGAAEPPVKSTAQIVDHHLAAVMGGNVEDILGDYADDAILISPNGITKGKDAIRAIFSGMRLGGNAPAPLDLQQKLFEGAVGYIVWTQNAGKPSEQHGSDTFFVHRGKITVQTVIAIAVRR